MAVNNWRMELEDKKDLINTMINILEIDNPAWLESDLLKEYTGKNPLYKMHLSNLRNKILVPELRTETDKAKLKEKARDIILR